MFIAKDEVMGTWTIYGDDGVPIIEDFATKKEAEQVAHKL